MWRYAVGAGAALLLAFGGFLLFQHGPARAPLAAVLQPAPAAAGAVAPLPEVAPEADAKTREQKRFDRYDKDRNEAVSRDEYFTARHKAFAKLDTNGDGRLSFEEWAAKSITKFTGADSDKSGALTRAEFATTAPKRRPPGSRCACGRPAPAPTPVPRDGDDEN
ncbi:EF-hand domain-containing protein [Sphingomonas sp. TDK1]|uniref:EF-hand domain-containing protein n=1 Tax=Sphingomonas sp. TDK1 TaxID=453247 RepID=UPI0007D909D3|nr:EF-hand domain-containing protein [Sphingomonas sp. TDK1]OAN62678.1 histidine kinase [Sphingomonas sp. TDK1]